MKRFLFLPVLLVAFAGARLGTDDVRDDLAGFFHEHHIADPDVFLLDLVFIAIPR